jgi:hypothetical protein
MRQRLGLAAALLQPRRLLVLDEPTNGLDPQGMREIRTLVRELAADGTTVFLSSHLLDEIEQVCTHAAVMAKGRLLVQGPVAELGANTRSRLEVTTADPADAVRVLKEHGVTDLVVDGDQVTGVVDWGNSMYGDFLFDIAWFSFWKPWYPAWRDIDFRAEAARHFASIGLVVENFETRMRCYETYIGLDGQAYQAFTRRWDDLAATAQRTLEVSSL